MKILSSAVAMEGRSTHVYEEKEVSTLRMWDNRKRENPSAPGLPAAGGDHLTLSALGLSLSQVKVKSVSESLLSSALVEENIPSLTDADKINKDELEEVLSDKDLLKLRLLEKMIEKMTGKKFKFNYKALIELKQSIKHPNQPSPTLPEGSAVPANPNPDQPQPVGWGIHFHHESSQYLKETIDFSSKGTVVTADGKSIEFQVNYHFSQEFYASQSIDFKAGDALIDPLFIRLEEGGLEFSDEPIVFDLDIDGLQDEMRIPINNLGLLFLDKNENNIADDGSELFGPTTGKGFDELRALDSDQNGWLDEADSAFSQMRIWIRSGDGSDQYLGLIEAGVGALFLGSVNTSAGMYASDLSQIGQMSQSGLYLKESGQPGIIHEIDLKI